jgi:hypothetical protein
MPPEKPWDNDPDYYDWLADNIYLDIDQIIGYDDYVSKQEIYDWYLEEKEEMSRLTAEQRLQFKREREALVGSLITQEGEFCGALVKEHVRGSQYVLRLASGAEVFASHKKRVESRAGLSMGGWRLWEDKQ